MYPAVVAFLRRLEGLIWDVSSEGMGSGDVLGGGRAVPRNWRPLEGELGEF